MRLRPCLGCGTPAPGNLCGRCDPNHGVDHRNTSAYQVLRAQMVAAAYADPQFACSLCGELAREGDKWTIDHIHPVAFGGSWSRENLAVAHASCNRRKGSDDRTDSFRRENAFA